MMKTKTWLCAALLAAGACGTKSDGGPAAPIDEVRSDQQRDTTPEATPGDVRAAAASGLAFAVDVYRGFAAASAGKGIFFSPHSIVEALAMTYAGARGTTAAEMRGTLHFTLSDEALHPAMNALDLALISRGEGEVGRDGQPFRLRVANSIWGQVGFNFVPAFLDTLAVHYGAGLHVVDFVSDTEAARVGINNWVEDATEGKIEGLVPQGALNELTRLVLTNAIYFNASWLRPFEPGATRAEPFQGAGNVPTMINTSGNYRLFQGDGVTAVSIPYAGQQIAMVVVMPQDLAAFESGLTAASLGAILAGVDAGTPGVEVDLHLPRWKMTASASLATILKALGMGEAFSTGADFSGINGGRDLFIQEVVHQATIAVDEKGTEAAAATAVIVGTTSIPEVVTVKIDRPFLYLIVDRPTGAVVFMGRVIRPE